MKHCLRIFLSASVAWWVSGATIDAEEIDHRDTFSLLDAVVEMLEHDPNLEIAQSLVETGRGLRWIAEGRFDPVASATVDSSNRRDLSGAGATSRTDSVDASVGVDVTTRLGTELSSTAAVQRTDADGAAVVDQGSVSFTARQPLLRGRGRRVTTAEERAAEAELAAARFDLHHVASQRVRAVANAYWQLKAAIENVEILRESEQSSRDLLETTRELIEADRLPRAELLLLEANLALKETARIQGERTVFDARRQLGREIGLSLEQARRLPVPGDPFPQVDATLEPEQVDQLAGLAYERRSDLAASDLRIAAAEARSAAAENDLLPQLDLFLTPSYVGRSTRGSLGGFFGSLIDDIPGLSTSISLGFSWPVRNRSAEGRFLLAQEVESRSRSTLRQLRNDLDANLAIAWDDLIRSALELERAETSAELFEQAARNEETKLRAGASTLIDVINQQDRFTLSQQSVISARRRLAQALIELRFETGSLLVSDPPALKVTARSLITTPEVLWPSR